MRLLPFCSPFSLFPSPSDAARELMVSAHAQTTRHAGRRRLARRDQPPGLQDDVPALARKGHHGPRPGVHGGERRVDHRASLPSPSLPPSCSEGRWLTEGGAQGMLAYDPSKRMSAKAALKSAYFDHGAYGA